MTKIQEISWDRQVKNLQKMFEFVLMNSYLLIQPWSPWSGCRSNKYLRSRLNCGKVEEQIEKCEKVSCNPKASDLWSKCINDKQYRSSVTCRCPTCRPKYEKILEVKRCKTQTFKQCEDDPRCSREIIQIPWWVITFKTAKSRRSIALNYQRIYCKPLVAKILCPKTCGHCK